MVQKNILVSILIANYNNSQHIKQCIESLNSQTYKNLEIIFFDDNSSDNLWISLNNSQMSRLLKIKFKQNLVH